MRVILFGPRVVWASCWTAVDQRVSIAGYAALICKSPREPALVLNGLVLIMLWSGLGLVRSRAVLSRGDLQMRAAFPAILTR